MVIGDKRPYLSVIIMIDLDNVEKFAQDRDVPFSNYASLTRAAEVQSLIQAEIDKVNTKFARVEQIKQFRLLDTQLTWRHHKMILTTKTILVPAVWRGNFGAAMLAAVGRM